MHTAHFCSSEGGIPYSPETLPPDTLPPDTLPPRYCTPFPLDTLPSWTTLPLIPYPPPLDTLPPVYPTPRKGHGTKDTLSPLEGTYYERCPTPPPPPQEKWDRRYPTAFQ